MENNLPFELPEFKLEELKDDGTDLGTFKSVKTLKEAYDNLRSCFTKNAMELAQIKKNNIQKNKNTKIEQKVFVKSNENSQNTLNNSEKLNKIDDLNAIRQEIDNLDEQDSVEKSDDLQSDKVENTPDTNVLDKDSNPPQTKEIWENADWDNKVDEFFKYFPNAKEYSSDIAKVLVNDKAIRESDSPLSNALVKTLLNNTKNVELDEEFIEKNILNNQKIVNRIIVDYLNKVKTNKSAPSVIATVEGTTVNANTHKTASNMAEAKELAKKFFK